MSWSMAFSIWGWKVGESLGQEVLRGAAPRPRRWLGLGGGCGAGGAGGGEAATPGQGGAVYTGMSGYDYRHWRGVFYPPGRARSRWLAYASRAFNSIELNGTFYSLKTPDTFRRWARESPDDGFVFAVK